ncbi:MAG: hypothetical protein JNK84_17210 [Phreatobacter sp.]|uniref:VOC family protein n=1 Tax=Phreatobacter sp. TaxID=1966341 RepID=UPI001A5455BB|nr:MULTISPECIES: VOC family protein [Hyphomicrobiales]MBL8570813.1 hypothetical protein [Phreatobacter sp.]
MKTDAAVIGHFDISGPDLASLTKFYEALFGWDIASRGPGYSQISTPSLAGGIVEAEQPSLTIGVVVTDLVESLLRAESEGGSVAMPATDNGWVKKGQIRDPAGNLLTLIQK